MKEISLKLIQVVMATGEIYGKNVSEVAATMFLADLAGFSEASIEAALTKCRRELRTFPTVADVIARMEDGRPGLEDAWALIPKDEDGSVVWTEEMAEAFGPARLMLMDGDMIGARMAFKEVYQRLVAEARTSGTPVRWSSSFGFDKLGRVAALDQAVQKGRLTNQEAQRLLPDRGTQVTAPTEIRRLAGGFFKEMPR